MADLGELQARIQKAQSTVHAEESALFALQQRRQRLESEKSGVVRKGGLRSAAYRELLARQAELEKAISGGQSRVVRGRADRDALYEALGPFTDPREHLSELSNAVPILLLPVRLETRFKHFPEEAEGRRFQLWVRVFPDDCSIDTFDEILSESEVTRARHYFCTLWRAGTAGGESVQAFVVERQRTAWRALMGGSHAGRAHHVITHYRPLNAEQIPSRAALTDRLLVIATTAPPSAAVQSALAGYWTRLLRHGGEPSEATTAFAAFRTATGLDEAAALTLLEGHTPVDWVKELEQGATEAVIRVSFLVFPEVDAKLNAWAQAARVRTFPERFVLLGYQPNDAPPVVSQLGAPIPDTVLVGPDTRDDIEALLAEQFPEEFDSLSDEEKAARYVDYLAQRSETKWLFDFDAAVGMGLGFRVPLTQAEHDAGFSRLMVVGVRMSASAAAGKEALEQLLLHHQFGDNGFAFVPQGTPTNNTEDGASGYSSREDADAAYARYNIAPVDPLPGVETDGARLATFLGIDAAGASLQTAPHFATFDRHEARAMQRAVYGATVGYFLDSMVPPVVAEPVRPLVRSHVVDFVSGRGELPAIRIGKQPYGIVPIANIADLQWLGDKPSLPGVSAATLAVLRAMYRAARQMREDLKGVLSQVAHVASGSDAHRALLQTLGLHAGSVEFDRRIAQSFDSVKNALYQQGVLGDDIDNLDRAYRDRGLQVLERLGYEHDTAANPEIPLLTRSFIGPQEDVRKPLVDDQPLSESRGVRAYTDAGRSYIEWLLENARGDHRTIRDEKGFSGNEKPQALLYDLLRHALNLEFGNAGLDLHVKAGELSLEEARFARLDAQFIGVQPENQLLESKWDIIYRHNDAIAPAGVTIAEHITSLLAAGTSSDSTHDLEDVLDALESLRPLPTARLERCLTEHLDCCHYRLDAWLLSFVHRKLASMRGHEGQGSKGIYLGAYGFVENLRPKNKELTKAPLDDVQKEVFDPEEGGDMVLDPTNAGYVQAPSVAHALTASVLRNAYISTASEEDADRYRVNLSSERVRMALSIIEGIEQGQGLAELLGYTLERGLHDNNEQELDVYIYELRKVFPLVARMKSTKVRKGRVAKNPREAARFPEEEAELSQDHAVTKVEARNVVNGLALLNHVKRTGNQKYPFGFALGSAMNQLKAASQPVRDAIDAEVQRLLNLRDAVADLAVSESVHQAVQGNFDRAAAALDTYSKGGFPQLPDVVQTPTSGRSLTHRFALHVPAGLSPSAFTTPRSRAEPAVNAWLSDILPQASRIGCLLRFRTPTYGAGPEHPWQELPVTLSELALEPLDLIYVYDAGSEKNLSALDDHVLSRLGSVPRRPDLEVAIDYLNAPAGGVSFFELGALLADLRSLTLRGRPLSPSDLSLESEGSKGRNLTARVDPARIEKAKELLDDALAQLNDDFLVHLAGLVDVEDPASALSSFTAVLAVFHAHLGDCRSAFTRLGLCGMKTPGAALLGDRQRAVYSELLLAVKARRDAFSQRLLEFEDILTNQLASAGDDQAKVILLRRAEGLVSARFTTEFVDVPALQAAVQAKVAPFAGKRDALTDFLATDFTSLKDQFAAAEALLAGMDAFDAEPLELAEPKRSLAVFVVDLVVLGKKALAEGQHRSAVTEEKLNAAAASPEDQRAPLLSQAAQALLGEEFKVFPEFSLTPAQVAEVSSCQGARTQLLQHQTNVVGSDHPLDDWLYGVARVREKMAAWENVIMLAEAMKDRAGLGLAPFELTPLQLPFRPEDTWLGLEVPASRSVESETLLYTAFAPGLAPSAPMAAIVVDEWTEVIPPKQETAALAFHYDRPSAEAPQAMLLVTPSSLGSRWTFQEVVGALHETLEMARLRALEPDLLDRTDYARLLPATVATLTHSPVTMMLDFSTRLFSSELSNDG